MVVQYFPEHGGSWGFGVQNGIGNVKEPIALGFKSRDDAYDAMCLWVAIEGRYDVA